MAAMKTIVPDAVTLYTQADQLLALFQRGDISMAPWYPDRAGSAIDKGLPRGGVSEGRRGRDQAGAGHPERDAQCRAGVAIHRHRALPRQPGLLHREAVCGPGQPGSSCPRRCRGSSPRATTTSGCGSPTRKPWRRICRTGCASGSAKWRVRRPILSELTLRGLTKRYADQVAVADVDLTVQSGEFVSLLGPSGCGKTHVAAHDRRADRTEPPGRILLGGTDVTRVPTNRRALGLVFQSYALFPHLSVSDNVALGCSRQGVRGSAAQAAGRRGAGAGSARPSRAPHAAATVGRPAAARRARPGASRRGRACCCSTSRCRTSTRCCATRCRSRSSGCSRNSASPALFVTHDQAEALSMSDRVCVLAAG